ncbi:MAG: hypothetical protein J6Q74_04280 [Clostridia bacterium]|nr:hypothetical protein [Clostridia bacterium]
MILVSNIKLPLDTDFDALKNSLNFKGVNVKSATLYKKSVDARKKNDVHFCCSVLIETDNEKLSLKKIKNSKPYTEPVYKYKKAVSNIRPVVIGFGPAGIFAAYTLAMAGLMPIVIERGDDVDTRKAKVDAFWSGSKLDTESNVQFGEGGAGTFSDGKLTTGISDIRCREVLKIFCENGANKNILTDAKAHIGTDILSVVIKNIRNKIIALGGEVRFGEKLEGVNTLDGCISSVDIKKRDGSLYNLPCEKVILAIGHSARDTLYMLRDIGLNMVKKPFAVGLRIEHPQKQINKALYGDFAEHPALSAASYKLAVHLENGRGVYTFCMCPGGYVVNASSEDGKISVNGMSYSDRGGENANSAILTEVLPEDLGEDLLSGIEFQRQVEEVAYSLTNGMGVPVETVGGYVFGEEFPSSVTPTIKPKAVFCDLSKLYPDFINNSLKAGIVALDKKLSGFADKGALLTGPETRSSSPVRMVRNEAFVSVSIDGLYPSGEGAGYAGGIMSAAVDGIKCAESLIKHL